MNRSSTSVARPVVHDNSKLGQRRFNRFVRAVLSSPLHPIMSRRLTLLFVPGRSSGRLLGVPIAYADRDGAILIAASGRWARNLDDGSVVELQHHGRRIRAVVALPGDDAGAQTVAQELLRGNPILRRFTQISLDELGRPEPDQVRAALARGVRFVTLRPR